MIVQQEKEDFKPIIITLETEAEARTLKSIMGCVNGHCQIREIVSVLFKELEKLNIDSYPGSIKQDLLLVNEYEIK